MNKLMKPYLGFIEAIQKQLESLQKIGNILSQYYIQLKKNFSDAISIIEPPDIYDSSKVSLHNGVHKTALNMVVFVDEMDKHPFCYLKERMLIGIDAHLQENYHLSLFAIFSAIDGMLTWFYVENHPGMPIPNIDKKLKEFFSIQVRQD